MKSGSELELELAVVVSFRALAGGYRFWPKIPPFTSWENMESEEGLSKVKRTGDGGGIAGCKSGEIFPVEAEESYREN
jgi:hypothetical protein